MQLEETISYRLAKVSVSHRNLLEKYVNEAGLHSGQFFVLFELWKKDGQRQVDLADKLNLAPPTVNKILGGLLEGDFVVRERVEDDARSSRIFLTDRGREVRVLLEEKWAELEDETLMGLTDTETLVLKQLLSKLLTGES